MSKQLKLRRGTTAQHSTFTGAEGEVTVDTTKDTLVVHDGATAGGKPLLTEANPSYTGTLTGGTGVVNLGSGQLYKDASGNVGIGTSSPASTLDVGGQTNIEVRVQTTASATAGDASLLLIGGRNTDAQIGRVRFYNNTTGSNIELARIQSSREGANDAANLQFFTRLTGGSIAERARIDQTGNLLVGKTSTDTTSGGLWLYSNLTYGRINFVKSTASGTAATPATVFYYNGNSIGGINCTSTATAYSTSSDYRLKHNIQPMQNALAIVAQLKPVTYKWNADDSESQGFIAHELQAVVPECVTGEKDAVDADGNPKYQGIDTSFLVATLTAAIQEQQATILAQQTALTALTARVEALEQGGV